MHFVVCLAGIYTVQVLQKVIEFGRMASDIYLDAPLNCYRWMVAFSNLLFLCLNIYIYMKVWIELPSERELFISWHYIIVFWKLKISMPFGWMKMSNELSWSFFLFYSTKTFNRKRSIFYFYIYNIRAPLIRPCLYNAPIFSYFIDILTYKIFFFVNFMCAPRTQIKCWTKLNNLLMILYPPQKIFLS